MPRSDLPRDELLQYAPHVEPPPDLDEFWRTTLDELSEVPSEIEVAQAGPELRGVRCAKLSFHGLGGARVEGWYVRPYGDGPFPGVVCYHGYGGRGARPLELYPLAAQGIAVLSMDCRGQCGEVIDPHVGESGGHARGWLTIGIRAPETYYYRSLYADAVRAVEVLSALDEVDEERIAVTGPSQGGGLSLAAAALSPIPKFVWADIPFLCHFQRAVDLASEGPYPEIAEFVRRMPDLEPTVWRTLSYFDNLVLAPRVTAATVITAGLWDDICPPSTIFPTFTRLGATDKELIPYSFLGHELTYEIDEARLLAIAERLGR
jgi:cephalosporin-C deacetylase